MRVSFIYVFVTAQLVLILLGLRFTRVAETGDFVVYNPLKSKRNQSSDQAFKITSYSVAHEPVTSTDPLVPRKSVEARDQCLDGMLEGTRRNCGAGNVIFELLIFVALAKATNRKPVISEGSVFKKASKVMKLFPNLEAYLNKNRRTVHNAQFGSPLSYFPAECGPIAKTIRPHKKCCTYDDSLLKSISTSSVNNVRLRLGFTQSYRYLDNFAKHEIDNLLIAREDVGTFADTKLFPVVEQRKTKQNVCVHIRRGDFVNNRISLPSDSEFTITALRRLLTGEYENADVYVMSNDDKWSSEQLRNFSNIFFAKSSKSTPVNAEWEFSRRYCDRVLLTASVSTYGWWIAYLSRGQEVFYNAEFSTPGGIEKQVTPEDFWLPSWTPIDLKIFQRDSELLNKLFVNNTFFPSNMKRSSVSRGFSKNSPLFFSWFN